MNRARRRIQNAFDGSHAKLRLNADLLRQLFHPLDALVVVFGDIAGSIGKLEFRTGQPRSPPIVVGHGLAPQLPGLARALGQQVLLGKAHHESELLCALAHQHHVTGMLHDGLRQQGNVLDVAHAGNGACHARWPMHAAGIELHHAVLVRKSAETDAVVVGIVLGPGDDLHHRVERVAPAGQHRVAAIEVVVAIGGADDDRLLRWTRRWRCSCLVGLALSLSDRVRAMRSR